MVAVPLAMLIIIAFLTSLTLREWVVSGIVAAIGVLIYWFSRMRPVPPAARATGVEGAATP
jgi:hypothetical protein